MRPTGLRGFRGSSTQAESTELRGGAAMRSNSQLRLNGDSAGPNNCSGSNSRFWMAGEDPADSSLLRLGRLERSFRGRYFLDQRGVSTTRHVPTRVLAEGSAPPIRGSR